MSFEEWYDLHKDDISEKVELRLSLIDLFASAYEAGLHADVHTDNSAVIAELEAQIDKMKCCGNCSHFKLDNDGLYPIYRCELIYPNRCKNHDKWEIKEK